MDAPGVQLVKDDWSKLDTIPDKSVDTFLSLKAAFYWGFESLDEEHVSQLIDTITKKSKLNATLRFDTAYDDRGKFEIVNRKLSENGWKVTTVEATTIAYKEK